MLKKTCQFTEPSQDVVDMHLSSQLGEDSYEVLDVFDREGFGTLQLSIVEYQTGPEVVHKGRKTQHHGTNPDGSAKLL
jgi:hypothetical protein